MEMTFEEWMDKVSGEVMSRIAGLFTIRDLPDQPYKVWYEEGMDPQEAADEITGAGI